MANDDDKDRRKQNASRNERPDIVEKCIGVWSSSTRAYKGSNSKIVKRRICNGVNFVVISKVSFSVFSHATQLSVSCNVSYELINNVSLRCTYSRMQTLKK